MKIPKRYTSEGLRRRSKLLPFVFILFPIIMLLQWQIDPTAKEYRKGEKGLEAAGGLNNEFLLLPLLGFREAAAGLLWVRCDEFFHSGDYDAILPLVRLITWLDPHADNVYVTGAWHLSYNFTDSSERSDRRYIPPAMKLLDEGIANNPNLYEIKFEKGWQLYDKIKDFNGAADAFEMALTTKPHKDSDDYPYGAPLRVMHTLAHAYEKQGRIPEALDTWQRALARANEIMATSKDRDKLFTTHQLIEAEKHNYALTLQRYRDRYATTGHSSTNKSPYPAVLRPSKGEKDARPWDSAFQPQVIITRPKVIKVKGYFLVADGARVDVRIADADYAPHDVSTTLNTFDVPTDQTILIDMCSVRGAKFEREMDMSRDPKMYGFVKKQYKIVLSYNPRATSPHLQDRFGWSGEGITDANLAHVSINRGDAKRGEPLIGTHLIAKQGGEGPVWDSKDEKWRQGGGGPNNNPREEGVRWQSGGQPARMIKVTFLVSQDDILTGNNKVLTEKNIVPND